MSTTDRIKQDRASVFPVSAGLVLPQHARESLLNVNWKMMNFMLSPQASDKHTNYTQKSHLQQ